MNIVKSIFFRATLLLIVLATSSYAQINTPAGAIIPFGSNPSYPNGMMPTNLPTGGAYGKSTDAANAYNTWKTNYIVSCAGGQFRVKFDDPNQTVSEGIAYGMLLAAYAADKALFDGLWAYYKANSNGNGVMNWRITGCNSVSGSNGATDAELDAALALLVADAQWPLATSPYDYTTEATTLINKIKNTEMDGSNFQATNGDAWGVGTDCRNPSYQAPAYYRVFGAAIPADVTFWGTNAVNGAYTLIQANANATTGLVSDWSNKAGATSACQSGSTSGLYGYDACRNPWRMGTDYIWNAESRARTQCDKIASYVNGQGAANCGGPRQQNGTGSGGHFATFVSTYATAIMGATPATYQNLLNSMYTQTVGVSDFYQNAQPSGYFGNTLRCVSLFMMSGNFWKPGTSITQEINVQRAGTNVASGSTIDLGNVQQGTNGDFTFTIQNLGATALTVTNPIAITGTGAAKYSILTAPGTTIAANGTTTFVLRFTPGAAVTGPFTATLSITNNDGTGGENPYVINVLTTGTTNPTAPEIDVQYNSTSYASGSTFNMGNVTGNTANSGTAYKTFTITNTGTASLTTAVAVTGTGYSIYGTPPTSVAAGASATFTIALNAGTTAPATRNGTVTITNNDGNEGTYTVNLTSSIVTCATSLTASQILQDYEANNNVTLAFAPPAGAAFSATATNPSMTGLNTSPITARITRDASTYVQMRYQPGCGSAGNFDMSNPVFSILMYSPAAGIPMLLSAKLTNGTTVVLDSWSVTSKVNQWERVYFDMSSIINNTTVRYLDIMIDPLGTYGSPSKIYYLDDFRYDVVPCITSLPSSKIFMDYDGERNLRFVYTLGNAANALTEVFPNPSATGINTSANVAKFVRYNGAGSTYQGWRYAGCQNKIDLSANPIISMLVRTATANVPITMSLTDGTGTYIGGATVNSGPANTWNKLYFDMTSIQTSTAIAFMDIYPDAAGAFLSNTTYYFDDIKYDVLPCAAPATANAGTDITICSGGSATLAGSITNATGSTWSGGVGTFTPNATTLTASYTPTAAEVTAGVATLTLTTTGMGSGCTAASDQVVITITSGLTTSAAGSDQTVCAATATLAGNTPTTGTGAWTVVSGTATVTTPSSPTSGVTGLGIGAATLRWTISGSGCTPSTDDVVITRNDVPTTSAAGSDQTVCAATATLAANTPTVGTGAWTVVSGTATVTTPTSPTSGVTALATGSATLRWTISNAPCTASSDDVIITRTTAPTTSAAGSDQTVCAATATLAGNTPTTGTGAWTVVSGTATVTTPSSPTSGVTGLGIGAATLRWTISNAPCAASTDDVVITRNDVPTTSAAGSDQTVCAATATLAANTPTVGTGAWTVVSGTATVTTPTSPTSGVTALVTGSATLRWTISNAPCTASSDDIIITRTTAPTTSAAGSDQTVCAATATLAGNTPTTGTGAWTVVSGTAIVTTPTSPTSGVTGIGIGSATLRWTISNAPCAASTDDVVITRNDVPTTSAAGSDQTICATTATLAANTPTVGTGAWTVVSGTATVTTPTSPTSGVTAIGVGSATLRWTISNAPCTASSDDVIITRTAAPTTSAAGSDQTVCAATSSLAGNTPTTGTGAWTVVSGTATITTPTSPTSGVTGIGIGAATLRWTISNAPCAASMDDVVITRNDVPTVSAAGTDQTICGSTTTLAGNTPTVGTGAWTVVSGTATITTPTSPTSGVTGLAVGANTLRWTISNAPCAASTDDVVINVTGGITTANAGGDQTVCASTATLAGNTPTTGTGAWTVISGTATVTTPGSPTSGVTGIGIGAATLRWTISMAGCTPSMDDVVITRNDVPTTSAAGSDQTICATTATLAANTPTVGTGAWTVVSGTATVTTPTSPTSGVTAIATGSATLRWTISNAPCTASSDDIIITRVAAPTTSAAGSDQTVCAATATLAGNTATTGTGAWTVISGTAIVTTPTSPTSGVTGIGIGAATLRWTISNAPCAASTDDVVITRNDVPTTSAAGSDQTVCVGTATLAANTPTVGTGAWTVVTGTATITTPTSPTSGVTGLVAGSATLRWTISNAPCAASTDDVVITGVAAPTISAAGSDQTVCATTATLAANTATTGTGAWTVISGTASVTTPTSPTSGVTGLVTGSATLRWTISNAPCAASSDDVVITRNAPPTTSAAGSDQSICATTTTLAGNTATTGTGTWTVVSGTATITTPSSPTSGVTGLGIGANTLRWTISNAPCAASTDDVIINVTGGITTADAGVDQTVCATTATLAGNTPTTGTGAWTVVSGTVTVTTPASPTSGVTGLATGSATLRWTISMAGCTPSTDDVVITRNAPPTTSAAGSDQTICGSTATLAGNTATTGAGAWTVISGTATVTTPTSPISGVTGLAVGSATLRWTISNAPCAASTDDVIITANDVPTTSNAGSDQDLCASTTATLAGNTATTGTGAWTVISGTASVTTPSSPTSGVTGLVTGSATLRWTISNAPCAPSADDVVITVVNSPTTSAAGSDQTICATSTTLAGNTATTGTGTWTVVAGTATITAPTSATSGVTGLGIGANTLRWTISNTPCAASTDDVIINVTGGITTADAGIDQNVLLPSTSATLGGNTPSSGTGAWSVVSGTATITTPSNPTSGVTGLGAGYNVLRWTISNGGCTPSTDDVSIFVGSTPGATTITGPTTVTANQTNVTYTFSPVNPGSVYTWSVPTGSTVVSSGPGTVTIDFGSNPGNVSLTETNPLGSHTSDLPVTIGATGVLYGLGTDTYEAYPSPFEDIANLKINSAETAPMKVKVMDSRGVVIYSSNEFFTNQNIMIGKEFAVGIYYVEISYQNKMQIIKLIKM